MPTNEDLGRAIRRLRQAQHLSLEDLAFKASMDHTYLSKIERGKGNPSWRIVCALARALDIGLYALVRVIEAETHGAFYFPGWSALVPSEACPSAHANAHATPTSSRS
jgi:transcriptional regulator with XRE-family HTH domain